jgi:hypothetical protein
VNSADIGLAIGIGVTRRRVIGIHAEYAMAGLGTCKSTVSAANEKWAKTPANKTEDSMLRFY